MSIDRKHVVELDVLRCLAAVFMIVNHGGYRLLAPDDATSGLIGGLVFVGSFAPVLFFFATGFGVALSQNVTGRAPPFISTAIKVMLLVAADQLIFWRAGSSWGVNFLGFIGLSSLLVSVIARRRASVPICLMLIFALLVARYGVGPRLFQSAGENDGWAWVFGVRDHTDMPYPPTPWLVYPLAGFVLGRFYAPVRLHEPEPRDRWYRASFGLGVALVACAGGLFAAGAIFFRWGTVSVAYFVLSLGVLALSGVSSMLIAERMPRSAGWLSLRGVASFAVIPIHYGLLELVATGAARPLAAPAFLPVIVLLCVICIWFSERFATGVSGWVQGSRPTWAAGGLVGLLLVSVVLALVFSSSSPPLAWVGMVAGQLSVAGLLAVRGRPRIVS